jgi:hypothetical protein
MWTNFGEGGRGARLRFRIEVNRARGHPGELRAIQYQANGKTLLNLINDDLDAAGLPHFLPWTASKIGAFSLLDDLHHESEIRLLFKHHQGVSDERQNDGPVQFWEVPIDQENNIASIKLTGIEAGPQPTSTGSAKSPRRRPSPASTRSGPPDRSACVAGK